jgi:sugar transferase (PEP-CTERM/EpsH1 system associated)
MKILFLCHRIPFPPRIGSKIRPFNILRHLSRTHEVTVASLARTTEEVEEAAGLAAHCHDYLVETVPFPVDVLRMIARVPTRVPSSMGYFYAPRLKRRIDDLLRARPFDLIFVHCSSVAQYVEDVRGPIKIIDFCDVDSAKWLTYAAIRAFPLSLGYRLEGEKLKRTEVALAGKFDLSTCATRAEVDTLQGYGVTSPTAWFPNGVDVEYFSPSPAPPEADTLCFLGRMDYYPNQQAMVGFCREILPRVRARRPSVRLFIVGAEPSREIRRLADIEGVEVTGTVPDVRPYVHRSTVSIAPLSIARGTQNKILEAMAMGVPVVASAIAARGTDVVPGEHLLVAANPADFAAATVRLLEDASFRNRIAAAGRARVTSQLTWPAAMARLDSLIENCVAARTGRRARAEQTPETATA